MAVKQGLEQRQGADQAWDHVPARLQVRVIPRAQCDPDLRAALAVGRAPVGVERRYDGADVPERRAGGVRIAAVRDHLHIGRLAQEQLALEIRINPNHEQDAALIDRGLEVLRPVEVGQAVKRSRAVQARHQVSRRGAAIAVQYSIGHVVQVIRRHVPVDQTLEHRRDQESEPSARVLENGQQLFPGQAEDATDRLQHSAPRFSPASCGLWLGTGAAPRPP